MKHDIPEQVSQAFKECGVSSSDALWDCHGTWVIKHKALEKIAAYKGVVFDSPVIIESESKDRIVAMLVTGNLDSVKEWSIGESSPSNTTNKYPYAMAEKRGKDRVILKLLGLHGDFYSEEEADDFKENLKKQPKIENELYNKTPTQQRNEEIKYAFGEIEKSKESGNMKRANDAWDWAEKNDYKQVQDKYVSLFGFRN
jgi:hypothetical protein